MPPRRMQPHDSGTHYHVKVGPYWHKVDRVTGRHEVIGKDDKTDLDITKREDGWHVTSVTPKGMTSDTIDAKPSARQ